MYFLYLRCDISILKVPSPSQYIQQLYQVGRCTVLFVLALQCLHSTEYSMAPPIPYIRREHALSEVLRQVKKQHLNCEISELGSQNSQAIGITQKVSTHFFQNHSTLVYNCTCVLRWLEENSRLVMTKLFSKYLECVGGQECFIFQLGYVG